MPRPKKIQNVEEPKSQSAKRRYERTETGDLVHLHKSRTTGSMIAVLRGPAELGYGTAAKWIDMCLAHHQFSIFQTRVLATASSNKSDEWCSLCAQQNERRPKRQSAKQAA